MNTTAPAPFTALSPSTASRRRDSFTPRDRTAREHTAHIDRVVWAADDDSRVILAMTDGSAAVGPGARNDFPTGQRFRFLGKWGTSSYGPQFQFDTCVRDTPATEAGVVKYLADVCRNVGRQTAVKLWAEFGPDAVRVLREEWARVVDAGIMNEGNAVEASEDLQAHAHLEKTRIDLFGLFAGRGFPGKIIDRSIDTWGVKAPEIIKRNPFALMVKKFPGCSFRRTDKMFLDFGYSADALKRQALAGWNAFREDRTGSTWLTADECVTMILALIPRANPIEAIRLLMRAHWVRIRRDGAARFLAVREKADAEQAVADHWRRLRRIAPSWPTEILTSEVEGDGLPSKHQAEQLFRAIREAIGAFVGGPGTGKTHTLAYLLKQAMCIFGRDSIRVCAPTGKASVRAGESLRARQVDIRATTIHQLLEIGRNGHDGSGWGFQRNATNPLECRFLVVDESSMIDATLMSDLLSACADGTNVLLIGDPYQLPPVGHGAPLRDLLDGGIAFGELTEVRRNSGSIVRACAAIKASAPVAYDATLDIKADDPKNLKLIECYQQHVPQTVQDVLASITKFDRVWDTQIITGVNDKGDCSRKKLNERLGNFLNPTDTAARHNPFKTGDKIICRRNTRLKCYAPITRGLAGAMGQDAGNYFHRPFEFFGSQLPKWYVANGEIGRVIAVSEKGSVVRFGATNVAPHAECIDVPLVWVPVGKRATGEVHEESDDGGKAGDFEHAWAITTHGAQGSEWPCVICVIDDAASMIADRNYWYTAISRAKTACLLVGPKGVLEKQVKRVSMNKRRTFLSELMKAGIALEGGAA